MSGPCHVHGGGRCRARGAHASRRRGVRRRGGRLRGTAGAVDPLRDDVLRRAGHDPCAPAAGRRRPPARRGGDPPRGGEASGAGQQGRAHHGAFPRRPCGAHLVRTQARGVGVRARSRPGAAATSAGDGERGRHQRRGGLVRSSGSARRGASLCRTRPACGRGEHAGDPARSSRRVRGDARAGGRDARQDGHGDPSPGADRGARGPRAVRRRPEGFLGHAAQAEPRGLRAGERARAGGPRVREHGARERAACGTSGTSRTLPRSAS